MKLLWPVTVSAYRGRRTYLLMDSTKFTLHQVTLQGAFTLAYCFKAG